MRPLIADRFLRAFGDQMDVVGVNKQISNEGRANQSSIVADLGSMPNTVNFRITVLHLRRKTVISSIVSTSVSRIVSRIVPVTRLKKVLSAEIMLR